MDSDARFSRIIDGYHTEPEALENALNSANQQATLKKVPELRRRIVTALAHHYRLLQTPAGNGVVARMITHQHLTQLRLHPQLWSLSRGLACRQEEYHAALGITDHTQKNQFAGDVQRSDNAPLTFIKLMLDVFHEEVDYMIAALSRHKLRESVMDAFRTNSRLQGIGIRLEIAPAFLALLIQGALPRSEFETFTGLQPEAASDQLTKLVNIGLVASPPSVFSKLQVGLPVWFAEDIFPDLHKS